MKLNNESMLWFWVVKDVIIMFGFGSYVDFGCEGPSGSCGFGLLALWHMRDFGVVWLWAVGFRPYERLTGQVASGRAYGRDWELASDCV